MRPEVRAVRGLLDAALSGLGDEEAERRPAPDRWSIAEILEHLARTYMGTAKGLSLCLADGRPRATPSSWRQRAGKLVVVTLGRFPRGIQSPDPVVPKGWTFAQARERAYGGLDAFDAAATTASERFGERAPILDHPVLGAFSARDWSRFHWVHTRHHMRPIANNRRAPTAT
jgi:hypothetical protein